MERGVKVSFVILFAILSLVLFIGIVNAYNSFSLIKEDRDSKKAVLIYDINPSEVIKDYETVIQMNYLEGDFLDLILYIKKSKITKIVYYQQENLPIELLDILRNEAGITLIKIAGSVPINSFESQEENFNEILITGKSTEEQQSRSYSMFIVLGIVLIVILAIVLILIPKKKRRK